VLVFSGVLVVRCSLFGGLLDNVFGPFGSCIRRRLPVLAHLAGVAVRTNWVLIIP
jgi:hypothetical protein